MKTAEKLKNPIKSCQKSDKAGDEARSGSPEAREAALFCPSKYRPRMLGVQAHDEAHLELTETEASIKMRITEKGQAWLTRPSK